MSHDVVAFIKVLGANIASWFTTYFAVVKLADLGAVVSILAGLGSVGVSIVSILWIRKQSRLADKKDHASWD